MATHPKGPVAKPAVVDKPRPVPSDPIAAIRTLAVMHGDDYEFAPRRTLGQLRLEIAEGATRLHTAKMILVDQRREVERREEAYNELVIELRNIDIQCN